MCGIAGVWRATEPRELEGVARAMADALRHRGPDGEGVWVERDADLAFGHRRLAIQDLSEAGAQPMRSASGRYTITYNGEVYNFPALRSELEREGARFRGGSDTEVILAAVERWGLEGAVRRFVGMFAFGLWDAEERRLHLVRDRLGIKPLYYGRVGSGLAFGSDLAAFHQVPSFRAEVDRDVLALYFRYACVPGEHCIYRGCAKAPPGVILTFDAPDAEPRRTTYWSALEVAERGIADPLDVDEEEAADLVEEALGQAITDRLIADVPVGVFLSGGIDSSVVTALMQARSSLPVRTFSIGFREEAYDEASDARRVAAHLGTDHTELYVTPEEAMAAIPDLPGVYTEPFADSSQLPTLLVCRMAREHVKVVLSGDGGDEVFGGYNRHLWGPRVWAAIRALPAPARRRAAALLSSRPPAEWDDLAKRWSEFLPLLRMRTPGDKAHKLAGLLEASDLDALYTRLTSIWPNPEALVLGAREPRLSRPCLPRRAGVGPQFMLRDMLGYLPDDILTKVDRASMSVGLETRVPLLDHRLVELAWRLPHRHKVSGGITKRVLRRVLARHVPRELFERPKMGFGVPIADWLRGPLRGRTETALDLGQGPEGGDALATSWRALVEGRSASQHQVWAALMCSSWRSSRTLRAA